jgi:hypothetical protein
VLLKDSVANGVGFRVEQRRGSHPANSSYRKTELVAAKLEMVRAAGLFHCSAAVSRIRWINTRDRLQRDEIDRRLQGGIEPSEGGSGRD